MKYLSITVWDVKVDPISQKHTITVVGTDNISEVDADSLIHCELNIPGTGYTRRKSVLYHPLGNNINILTIHYKRNNNSISRSKVKVCLFNVKFLNLLKKREILPQFTCFFISFYLRLFQ